MLAMKMNKNQPRNSSTNTRALSTRLQNIENNQKLAISLGKAPPNPPPVTNRYKWVKRLVTLSKTFTSGSTGVIITAGDISTALAGLTGDFTIRSMTAWVIPSISSTGIFQEGTFTVYTNNLLNGGSGQLPVAIMQDYGTGTSLPGMSFKTPATRTKNIECDTASVIDLIKVTSSATAGSLVLHVSVMQCIQN